MRQILFAIAMVCLLFIMAGQVKAMTVRAEAAPLLAPDTLIMGEPFTVGIYMNNNDSVAANPATGYRLTYSMPFSFYSPDASIQNVTHINVGGIGPTGNIEILNGFDGFWNMFFQNNPWSYEGNLPDSINFTGIATAGWPFNLGEQLYLQFNFQSDEAGTFCIDSIGGRTPTFDWLLDPPSPDFNGPYCWSVVDTSAPPPNQPPVLYNIGNKEADENSLLTFIVYSGDPDATTPTLFTSTLPTGADFVDNPDTTGTFSWTPTFDQAGSYPVTFYATDGIDTVFEEITITVNDVNRPPELTPIGDQEVFESNALSFLVNAIDDDGDPITLSTSALPGTATFVDSGNGVGLFDWTPYYTDAGVYTVTFYADDSHDIDSEVVTITVDDVGNQFPVLDSIGPIFLNEGDHYVRNITAWDPDGTIPSIGADSLPPNAAFFDSGTGVGTFTFNPDLDQSGTYNILFYAWDGMFADTEIVVVTVNETGNYVPELSVQPNILRFEGNICDDGLTPAELDSLSFDISNTGEGTLNWTVTANESWLGFEPANGVDAGTIEVWIVWANVPEISVAVGDTAYLYDTLTISAPGADNSPQTIAVELMLVCEPNGYFLVADPTSFTFSTAAGDTAWDTLTISEMYGQEVQFTYTNSSSWLHLPDYTEPPTTLISIPFYVSHDNIMPGYLYDTIVVTSLSDPSNTPLYIPVQVTILMADLVVLYSPDAFEFNLELGDSLLDQSFYIYEEHGYNLEFSAGTVAGSSWLNFHDHPDNYMTPESVFFDINTTGLIPGVYYDTISADDAGYIWDDPMVSVRIPVTLTVDTDYVVNTTPEEFNFVLNEGEVTSSSLNVFEIFGREIGFLYYNNSSWLAVNPLGMPPYNTPMSLPLGVSTIGLDSGMYYDTILITPDVDSNVFPNVAVPVTLEVVSVGPETEDSVWVSTVPGRVGTDVIVPVYFRNFEPLAAINLPLAWNSDDLQLNEVTFDGTRVDSVDNKPVVIDNATRRVQIDIMPIFSDPIYAGRGLLAKLHFSVSPTADPAFVAVYDTIIPPSGGLSFFDESMNMIAPHFDTGGVIVGPDTAYLCGRVIDTAGNEIEGAFVEIWNDFPNGYWVLGDTTDIAGQFACHSVGISPFDVYAYKEGYYPGLVEDVQLGELGIEVVLTPVSPVTPTNEWVGFYCQDNFYSGVPLPVGSVVDAYDPDGVHCGTFYVDEAGKYGIMPVYRDDIFSAEDEGAEPGDSIAFFINGVPATTDGETIWTAMGDNFETCLDVFTVEDRTIHLAQGWNLISWNVDTPSDNILQILSSISNCIEIVLGFEQGGYTYDPELPEFSTLWNLDHFHGYWVRTNCAADLVITGVPVAATTPIQLEAGWNLVSYLPQIVDTIPHALSSIHDQLVVALGFVNGVGLTYDPSLPGYSNLNYMGPGYGYWVNVLNDGDLIYPGTGPSVVFRQTPTFAAKAIPGAEINVSRQWMNLYSYELTLDGNVVPAGAEIQAVDADGRVIGAAEVGKDGMFGFMPVYADDPATDVKEGVAIGDEFILVVNGVESAESFTWTANGDRLEVGPLTARTGAGLLPKEFKLAQNYPNPFNPATTILFSLPEPMNATVEVFNILGERVKTVFNGLGQAGENSVVWNGDNDRGQAAASGVYFYRLKAGDFQQSRKMILMK